MKFVSKCVVLDGFRLLWKWAPHFSSHLLRCCGVQCVLHKLQYYFTCTIGSMLVRRSDVLWRDTLNPQLGKGIFSLVKWYGHVLYPWLPFSLSSSQENNKNNLSGGQFLVFFAQKSMKIIIWVGNFQFLSTLTQTICISLESLTYVRLRSYVTFQYYHLIIG